MEYRAGERDALPGLPKILVLQHPEHTYISLWQMMPLINREVIASGTKAATKHQNISTVENNMGTFIPGILEILPMLGLCNKTRLLNRWIY